MKHPFLFVETFDSLLAVLREGEMSFDEKHAAILKALRAESEGDEDVFYRYIEAIYDTFVVFCEYRGDGCRYFKANYSLDESGAATIGSASEVKRVVTWEDVLTEAQMLEAQLPEGAELVEGAFVKLVEAADDNGEILVKIIRAGWGSSGYYGAEMLKRDGATAFPAGTKMFWNHPTATERRDQPERDCDKIAATLIETAYWDEEGKAGPGLYAKARVKKHYRERVAELMEDIGSSIYAAGKFEPGEAEGQKGRIVTQLLASVFNTVDFVTYPGAGGEIVSLFESACPASNTNPKDTMTPEEIKALEAKNAALTAANATLAAENLRLSLYSTAREAAKTALEATKMPDVTRENVIEACAKAPIAKEDGTLDVDKFNTRVKEAAESALKYLAEATGRTFDTSKSPVRGAGGPGTGPVRENASTNSNNIPGLDVARTATGLM